jgi:hypothetical protein
MDAVRRGEIRGNIIGENRAMSDPDNAVADLQRDNAELGRQLDACRAELAARNSEYGERIEHQSATIDVLKTMSASPGDPQAVQG